MHVLIHNSLVVFLYLHLFPLMPNPFVSSGMHTEKPRFIESGETQLFFFIAGVLLFQGGFELKLTMEVLKVKIFIAGILLLKGSL